MVLVTLPPACDVAECVLISLAAVMGSCAMLREDTQVPLCLVVSARGERGCDAEWAEENLDAAIVQQFMEDRVGPSIAQCTRPLALVIRAAHLNSAGLAAIGRGIAHNGCLSRVVIMNNPALTMSDFQLHLIPALGSSPSRINYVKLRNTAIGFSYTHGDPDT